MPEGVEAEVAQTVRAFARRALDPLAEALARYPEGEWPGAVLEGLDELGLLEPGALDDPALQRAALEALGNHSAAVAVTLFAHCFGARLAPSPIEGLFGSACYADVHEAPALIATRTGDDVTLRGAAPMVVNAPIARWLSLFAELDGAIAIAVVATDAPGLTISEPIATLGARGCPVADVSAEGARATEVLVAPPVELAVRRARGPAAAIGAGVLAASLETARSYAEERYQGGGPIVEHAQVRAMLADMAAKAALCRELSLRLCEPNLCEETSAGLFVSAKDALTPAASLGVQLLGGYGYMADYPQEGRLRDARQLRSLLGRADVLLQRIGDRSAS